MSILLLGAGRPRAGGGGGGSESTTDPAISLFLPFSTDYNDHGPNALVATVGGTPSRTDRLIIDAAGDYLTFAGTTPFIIGGAAGTLCTVEFRLKTSVVDGGSAKTIISHYTAASGDGWGIQQINGKLLLFSPTWGSAVFASATSCNDGVEHHWAFVRTAGNDYKWFRDGVQDANNNNTFDFFGTTSRNTLGIGITNTGGSAVGLVCELDDVRISKGVAQYTSGFTVPARGYGY